MNGWVEPNRRLHFTEGEMARLRHHCRALGTSYREFIHDAVLHALDECDAIDRAERGIGEYLPEPWSPRRRPGEEVR